MCLVSVIVPVYNIEKYIKKCVESLIDQSLAEIEILLINDGSTDGSRAICESYTLKDKRVHLIDQINEGVSAARNKALAHAKGKYILFVDGDDYVSPNIIEELYASCEKEEATIGVCEFVEVHDMKENVQPIGVEKEVLEQGEIINKILAPMIGSDSISKQDEIFRGYVWRTLYRRDFIEEHQLYFEPVEEVLIEDLWFNVKAYYYAKKVALVKKPLYYYVHRKSSLTNHHREQYFEAAMRLKQRLETFMKEHKLEQQLEMPLMTRKEMFLWDSIYIVTHPTNPASFKQKIKEVSKICENKAMKDVIETLPRKDLSKGYRLKCRLIKKGHIRALCILMVIWHYLKEVKNKEVACDES